MRVDVSHRIGVHTGISKGCQHAASGAVHVGCRHVEGIAREAHAGQFCVDLGAPSLGMLVFLKHHDPSTLPQYEAVTALVPRTRRRGGVVIAG